MGQAQLKSVQFWAWRANLRSRGNIAVPAVLVSALLGLSACGAQTSNADINRLENQGLPAGQSMGDSSGLSWAFGKGASGGAGQAQQIQVNAYLWRATLDTLSFMPLVSADPFGGVIITDWYSPASTPGERFKVNAYILSKQLTANAIQVSVFHQVQSSTGWVDEPADPSLASGLEDRILARAANLQAASQNAGQ
jgi:hypothetical protein